VNARRGDAPNHVVLLGCFLAAVLFVPVSWWFCDIIFQPELVLEAVVDDEGWFVNVKVRCFRRSRLLPKSLVNHCLAALVLNKIDVLL